VPQSARVRAIQPLQKVRQVRPHVNRSSIRGLTGWGGQEVRKPCIRKPHRHTIIWPPESIGPVRRATRVAADTHPPVSRNAGRPYSLSHRAQQQTRYSPLWRKSVTVSFARYRACRVWMSRAVLGPGVDRLTPVRARVYPVCYWLMVERQRIPVALQRKWTHAHTGPRLIMQCPQSWSAVVPLLRLSSTACTAWHHRIGVRDSFS